MRSSAAVLALALAAGAAAPAAANSPGWSAPSVLAPNVDISGSAVQSAGGQTIAAWAGNTGVFAAVARRGQAFGFPQRLSRHSIANDVTQLLATDGRGDAVVMWKQGSELFVSYRRRGRAFGVQHRVARDVGSAVVGMDGRGDVTIAWDQLRPDRKPVTLEVSERLASGRYTPRREVASGDVHVAGIAVNARNRAALVWQAGPLPRTGVVAATRGSRGTFGAPVTVVSQSRGGTGAQVGIDRSGRALIAWEGPYDGAAEGNPFRYVKITSLRVGATRPGRTQVLRTPRGSQLGDPGPLLEVNARGDAIVVWQNVRDNVVAARSRSARPFGATRTVGTSYAGGTFAAAIGPTGAAIVSWDSLTSPVRAVIASGRSRPWGRAVRVAPPQDDSAEPAVTIDSASSATAVWQDLGPANPSSPSTKTPLLYASTR